MSTKSDDIKIDIYRLENECAEQAQLLYDAGVEFAEACYKYSEAKKHREEVEAKLDFQIRSDPARFGLRKATENSISSAIKLQPEYQEAVKAELRAEYERDLAKAKRDAFGQRGSLLKEEVALWVSNYYADAADDRTTAAIRERKQLDTHNK